MSDTPPASPPDTPPAATTRLGDLVYDRMLALIGTGDFAEGSRLPGEVELGRRLGASRPVVREALARLRDDGLIRSRQGSGSYVMRRPDANVFRFVAVGSVSDIQRCYDFRIGFEAGMAALAATAWRPPEIEALQQAAEDLALALGRGDLGVEADAQFHRCVAAATRNAYYISVQGSLEPNIRVGMNLSRNLSLLRPATRAQIVQQEHAAIMQALLARDSGAAATAMARHIGNARHRMFEGSEPPETPAP